MAILRNGLLQILIDNIVADRWKIHIITQNKGGCNDDKAINTD